MWFWGTEQLCAAFKYCSEVSVVTFIHEVVTPWVDFSILVCLFLNMTQNTQHFVVCGLQWIISMLTFLIILYAINLTPPPPVVLVSSYLDWEISNEVKTSVSPTIGLQSYPVHFFVWKDFFFLTSAPPVPTTQVVRLEVCITLSGLCAAGNGVQGLVYAKQALSPLRSSPSPKILLLILLVSRATPCHCALASLELDSWGL